MINTISTYRRLIASLLTCWMTLIVISGIVFMHKEVTSKGEIITHIHPYDFTKKQKHHHKNDAEIRFLDVLYQGTFIESEFTIFEVPVFNEFSIPFDIVYNRATKAVTIFHSYLRGPPSLV
ncbi:hypothetical protein [Sphingobacterium litopenaei]|uniref:hypothetical protein n=1 Tax=Sphingobacterium litopenaei TaxID=2763500 RepID=UPI00293BA104|nr:hypothetical protein [Sphingobacterium litopenaei]